MSTFVATEIWFSFWTPAAAKTVATDVGGLLKINGGAFFATALDQGVKMREKAESDGCLSVGVFSVG